MLPPERRLGRVQQLIEERKYFTLHAGRQTGKTTSLMWLARHLNASGRWRAVWVETAREQPDLAAALSSILKTIDRTLRLQHAELARPDAEEIAAVLRNPATALLEYLIRLTALDERPLAPRQPTATEHRNIAAIRMLEAWRKHRPPPRMPGMGGPPPVPLRRRWSRRAGSDAAPA